MQLCITLPIQGFIVKLSWKGRLFGCLERWPNLDQPHPPAGCKHYKTMP